MAELSLPATHSNAPGAAGCHLKTTGTGGSRKPRARTRPLAYSAQGALPMGGWWLY